MIERGRVSRREKEMEGVEKRRCGGERVWRREDTPCEGSGRVVLTKRWRKMEAARMAIV